MSTRSCPADVVADEERRCGAGAGLRERSWPRGQSSSPRRQAELAGHQEGARAEQDGVVGEPAFRSRFRGERRQRPSTGLVAHRLEPGSPSAVGAPRRTIRRTLSAPISPAMAGPRHGRRSGPPSASSSPSMRRATPSSPAGSRAWLLTARRRRSQDRGRWPRSPGSRSGRSGRRAVVDDDVADLAGPEAVAVKELAIEHEPGADPVPDLDRDQVRRPVLAPNRYSRARPPGCRWPRRSAGRSGRRRRLPSGRSCQSRLTAQRIVPSPSTMPGVPTPIPRIWLCGRRAARRSARGRARPPRRRRRLRARATRAAGSRPGGSGGPRRTSARRGPASTIWRASSTSETRVGALPPLDGPRPTSSARPSAVSSATRSPTEVRVRPVRRAISARLIGPWSYSARRTMLALCARVWAWVALVGNSVRATGGWGPLRQAGASVLSSRPTLPSDLTKRNVATSPGFVQWLDKDSSGGRTWRQAPRSRPSPGWRTTTSRSAVSRAASAKAAPAPVDPQPQRPAPNPGTYIPSGSGSRPLRRSASPHQLRSRVSGARDPTAGPIDRPGAMPRPLGQRGSHLGEQRGIASEVDAR